MQNREKNDSEIAKAIKTSKPSVSHMRKKLEREGILAGCTPMLDFEKFGVSFYTVMVFRWNAYSDRKLTEAMEKDFTSTPPVVYFAEGANPNSKYIAMMAFLSFENYNNFLEEFRSKYGKQTSDLETFFVQPKRILKQSYGDLAKMLMERMK